MVKLPDDEKSHSDHEVMDQWEDFVKERYPKPHSEEAFNPTDPNKQKEAFRDYEQNARPSVREFYRQNHTHQTYDFVREKKKQYLSFSQKEMGIWEAAEFLNTLVDDSDPDTNLSQLQHLLQTSEAIRRDDRPRWMILTGFIHDLGKVLCLYGEPQWAVVGDTFPVGCAFSDRIVFPGFFAANPDMAQAELQTPLGFTRKGAGWMPCIFPGATTSMCIRLPSPTFRLKVSTCYVTTVSTPGIARGNTITCATKPIVPC